jgi:hypothetical protein
MFTEVAAEDLLREVRAHDFGADPVPEFGANRIDAVTALDLCVRSHTLKHLPGWVVTTKGKATIWKTPTGHTYRSDPPAILPHDQPGHLRQ